MEEKEEELTNKELEVEKQELEMERKRLIEERWKFEEIMKEFLKRNRKWRMKTQILMMKRTSTINHELQPEETVPTSLLILKLLHHPGLAPATASQRRLSP